MTELGLVKNHDKKVITNTKPWCVITVNNGKNHDEFSLKKGIDIVYFTTKYQTKINNKKRSLKVNDRAWFSKKS